MVTLHGNEVAAWKSLQIKQTTLEAETVTVTFCVLDVDAAPTVEQFSRWASPFGGNCDGFEDADGAEILWTHMSTGEVYTAHFTEVSVKRSAGLPPIPPRIALHPYPLTPDEAVAAQVRADATKRAIARRNRAEAELRSATYAAKQALARLASAEAEALAATAAVTATLPA